MAKRMNLDETWKNCLSMWRHAARKIRAIAGFNQMPCNNQSDLIDEIKDAWCEKRDFKNITHDCFFCNFAGSTHTRSLCCNEKCPARRVDNSFYCDNDNYHYLHNPIAFYNKLMALDRKRKKK